MLMRGRRWHIGNGSLVKIRLDLGVPGFGILPHPVFLNEKELQEATINCLMDSNLNLWNVKKFKSMFNVDVAIEILKIDLR